MSQQTISYITLVIAIGGFILSSTQWIYTLYCKRVNFKVSIEKFEWYEYEKFNRCTLTLSIENLSNLPLIITRMNIGNVQCYLSHHWIGERYFTKFPETDIPCTERILSADFPINIVANSGTMHGIVFDFYDKSLTLGKLIELKIQTTNKLKTFTLYCPDKNNTLKL